MWIGKLQGELNFPLKGVCDLYCDNKATISIYGNPVQHDRTKHVEIDRHFIREKLKKKIISLSFVRSKDQLTDILTKAVTPEAFDNAICKLSLSEPYDLT